MTSNIGLTIDLGAITANWRLLRDKVAPAECAAVVKADAYGLGLPEVGAALYHAGCRSFYVAYVQEGLTLRDELPAATIYILNGIPAPDETAAFAAHLVPVVNSRHDLARLSGSYGKWTASIPFPKGKAKELPITLHVDTGLHRLGIGEADVMALHETPALLSGVHVDLLMSHLAVAEDHASPMNQRQRKRFLAAVQSIPVARTSLANSPGIFLGRDFHFDQVRPGAALYGINPTPGQPNPMHPVVTLEARILQINEVQPGESVGYGGAYMIDKPSRIATLSIGYADGVIRALGNLGQVFAGGQLVPIAGRVSMDLITIDITALAPGAVEPGSFVEIIGPNRPIDDVAADAGTIGYEVLTGLGRRAGRVYVNGV